MENQGYTDEELLRLLKDNLEEGAAALLEAYSGLVCWVCSRRLSDPEDVKECVNDTFAGFCREWTRFDQEKGTLKNYLCLLADRQALSRYRKNQRYSQAEGRAREQERVLPDVQEYTDLEEAIQQLKPVDQEIIRQKYFGGLNFHEIAARLDFPYETVKKRNQRALKKLLKILLIGGLLLGLLAGCAALLYHYFQFREGSGVNWELALPQYQLTSSPPSCEADGLRFSLMDMEYQDGELHATLLVEPTAEIASDQEERHFQELLGFYTMGCYVNDTALPPQKERYSEDIYLDAYTIQRDLFFQWEPEEQAEALAFTFSLQPSEENGEPAVWMLSGSEVGQPIEYTMQGPTPSFEVELQKTDLYTDPHDLGQVVEHELGSLLLMKPQRVSDKVLFSLYPLQKPEQLEFSSLLVSHFLGLGSWEKQDVYLTDAQGSRQAAESVFGRDFQEEVQIYFLSVKEGTYTLHIPYLCWQGSGADTIVRAPLPDPGERLPLEQEVALPAGGTVRFTGIYCEWYQEELRDLDIDGAGWTTRIETYRDYFLEVALEGEDDSLRLCAVQLQDTGPGAVHSISTEQGERLRFHEGEQPSELCFTVSSAVYVQPEEVAVPVYIGP